MFAKLAISLIAVATPVAALQAQSSSFTSEGQTYTYVAQRTTNGSVRLTGKVAQSGQPFDLLVRNRRVAGTMAGNPVDFLVSPETVARLDAEVGSKAN